MPEKAPLTPLGQRIEELSKQAGLNRPALARKADVSYSFLVQIQTGQRVNPQHDKLAKVATALGVSVEALLAVDEPLPVPMSPDLAELRQDLISRIHVMDEAELRRAARLLLRDAEEPAKGTRATSRRPSSAARP